MTKCGDVGFPCIQTMELMMMMMMMMWQSQCGKDVDDAISLAGVGGERPTPLFVLLI